MVDSAPITHACPPDGSGLTPCCGRTPFELDRTSRMTVVSDLVTCSRRKPGPQNTDDSEPQPFVQPSAPDPIGDLKRWLQHLADAKPTLIVTPETRDQIRGLAGRDDLPGLPCKIVANPYMPEGTAYLFDAALIRAVLDAPEQQGESVTEPHAFAAGDHLAYRLPPEPPPGSIVKDRDGDQWTRDGSGAYGWTSFDVTGPDESDNGMTWDGVLRGAYGDLAVVRVGWDAPTQAAAPHAAP